MIVGIQVTLEFSPPAPFTGEWIDALYTSLERNMAIKSIDIFANEDAGELRFIIGVDGFDHCDDDFFKSVAVEAVERALDDAAGPNTRSDHERPVTNKVLAFAR